MLCAYSMACLAVVSRRWLCFLRRSPDYSFWRTYLSTCTPKRPHGVHRYAKTIFPWRYYHVDKPHRSSQVDSNQAGRENSWWQTTNFRISRLRRDTWLFVIRLCTTLLPSDSQVQGQDTSSSRQWTTCNVFDNLWHHIRNSSARDSTDLLRLTWITPWWYGARFTMVGWRASFFTIRYDVLLYPDWWNITGDSNREPSWVSTNIIMQGSETHAQDAPKQGT
jgi:hypothetical protein